MSIQEAVRNRVQGVTPGDGAVDACAVFDACIGVCLRGEGPYRAKPTFFANMSHETRPPTDAIIGLTELMRATRATRRCANGCSR
jgi:hypothetical protein